jgi:hypothetical protein
MSQKKQNLVSSAVEAPVVPTDTNAVDQLYLYAFTTQREVNQYIRTRISKSGNMPPEEILGAWRNIQVKVRSVVESEANLASSINFKTLDPNDHPRLKEILMSPGMSKNYFATSTRFALVDVDRLIAPQRHVNLEHVKKIQSRVPKQATLDDLIEICLASGSGVEPVQHSEVGHNFHVFSSQSGDLRFLGAFVKDLQGEIAEQGGVPAGGIVAFVGYGASEINVYEVGSKMILNNGFHRVYALRQMGFKELPVLVQEIKNPSLEVPGSILGVSSGYLLNHSRPVLLKDFFDEGFAIKLKVPKTVRTVKVRVMTEQFDLPI